MSQQRGVIRYNPYTTPGTKRDDPKIAEAWERAKTEAPNFYRKHQQMEAYFLAQQPILDAMLNDSDLMAELEAIMQSVRQKQHAAEFAVLGVEPGATKRDVKNAYRRKARKLHPDVGGDAEAFKQLYAAYRALLKVARD